MTAVTKSMRLLLVRIWNFKDTVASHAVTAKGTSYKKGMYILLGKTEEELEVGKIELVIVHHGSVSFISEKYLFVKLSDIGVYCILGPAQEQSA